MALYGSGLFIIALQPTIKLMMCFKDVSFHVNKPLNKLDNYQSAVSLMNIENVILTKLRLVIMTQVHL